MEVAAAGGRGLRHVLALELHDTPAAVALMRLKVKVPFEPSKRVEVCVRAWQGGCVCVCVGDMGRPADLYWEAKSGFKERGLGVVGDSEA